MSMSSGSNFGPEADPEKHASEQPIKYSYGESDPPFLGDPFGGRVPDSIEQAKVVSYGEEYPGKVTSYGEQLRYERELRGWTVEHLAEQIGVSPSFVQGWETNHFELDSASRLKLSKILGNDYYLSSKVLGNGDLQVRVVQRELTAQSVATIIPALTELYIKCWLIVQGRYAELIEYAQTRNIRFFDEPNLVITKIAYNSPLEFSIANLDPMNIAKAINEIVQAKEKLRAEKIANLEREAKLQQDEKRAEQDYQAKQQELAIEVQKAAQEYQMAQIEQERLKFELEKQRLSFQIEYEKQKLELVRQQVAIQKEQLELVTMPLNYDIEAVKKLIDMLQPDADQMTRAMLIPALLPNLLQLDSSKGLNLALPVPQNSEWVPDPKEETKASERFIPHSALSSRRIKDIFIPPTKES